MNEFFIICLMSLPIHLRTILIHDFCFILTACKRNLFQRMRSAASLCHRCQVISYLCVFSYIFSKHNAVLIHTFAASNVERLRDFVKHVFVDRRYTGEKSFDKPPKVKMVKILVSNPLFTIPNQKI